MLGLKATTPTSWAKLVKENLDIFLTDHAYNEMKAAQSAMAVINHQPGNEEFVKTMSALAIEEMQHFEMVYEQIQKLNFKLGKEQMNEYAMQLRKFFPKTKDENQRFYQKLMLSSLIEARSCERFSVLAKILEKDYPALSQFYKDLFASEARHYSVFLNYARDFAGRDFIDPIWEKLLTYEAQLIRNLGKKPLVHG